MRFVSTRIITVDVERLVAFYEMVTDGVAVWGEQALRRDFHTRRHFGHCEREDRPAVRARVGRAGGQSYGNSGVHRGRCGRRVRAASRQALRGGERADDNAVVQSRVAFPGPRRESSQSVHAGHGAGAR